MLKMARFKQRQAVAPAELRHWFASQRGTALQAVEQRWLEQRLQRCFGSYLVQYNTPTDIPRPTDIRYQVRLGTVDSTDDVRCAEHLWPICPGGADVVILQHSLDFARSPYDLLREAALAVRPGGYLLLTGRNPWWQGFAGQQPWRRSHGLRAARVAEWLAVLGFACEPARFEHYLPASWQGQASWLENFLVKRQWPLGACYMIAARKQVHAAPAERQRSRRLQELLPIPVARQNSRPDLVEEQRKHD